MRSIVSVIDHIYVDRLLIGIHFGRIELPLRSKMEAPCVSQMMSVPALN